MKKFVEFYFGDEDANVVRKIIIAADNINDVQVDEDGKNIFVHYQVEDRNAFSTEHYENPNEGSRRYVFLKSELNVRTDYYGGCPLPAFKDEETEENKE